MSSRLQICNLTLVSRLPYRESENVFALHHNLQCLGVWLEEHWSVSQQVLSRQCIYFDYLDPCRDSIGWGSLANANDQSGMSFGNFPHPPAIVLAMKHMEFCPAHHIGCVECIEYQVLEVVLVFVKNLLTKFLDVDAEVGLARYSLGWHDHR